MAAEKKEWFCSLSLGTGSKLGLKLMTTVFLFCFSLIPLSHAGLHASCVAQVVVAKAVSSSCSLADCAGDAVLLWRLALRCLQRPAGHFLAGNFRVHTPSPRFTADT